MQHRIRLNDISREKAFNRLDITVYLFSLLTIFSLPWRNALVVIDSPTLTIGWVTGGLFGLLWTVSVLLNKNEIVIHRYHLLFFALPILAGISSLWTVGIGQTVSQTVTFIYLTAFIVAFTEIYSNKQRVVLGLQAIILGLAVLAIGATLQYADAVFFDSSFFAQLSYGRASPFGINPNNLGNSLVLGIPIVFFLSTKTSYGLGKTRYPNYLLLLLSVVAIVLSGSRGALVSLGVVAIYLYVYSIFTSEIKTALVLVLVGLIGVIVAVFFTPSVLVERLSSIQNVLSSFDPNNIRAWVASIDNRGYLWISAFESFKQNPLLGVGAGNIRIIGNTAHSVYILMLVELGLVGLGIYMLILLLTLRLCVQHRDYFSLGILVAWATISVANDWAFVLSLVLINFIILLNSKYIEGWRADASVQTTP
jgi:O-antigen ligase